MGLRMIGACLCMLALFHKHIVPYLTPKIIVPALVVGLTYWGTMVTQTIGLQTIEPGRSAFLTAAYCVLTPFATWIISKTRPKAINLVAGVICLIGVGFVSLEPGGSLSLSAGDWLTIATAVIFLVQSNLLGVYTKRFDLSPSLLCSSALPAYCSSSARCSPNPCRTPAGWHPQ
mgnify:FL=1